jgi:RHS repeat-associated protein
MDRGGSTYYYHQNALSSVEAVTNSSGNPVERYDYCGAGTLQCGDPYGAVSITDGSFNPIPANSWGTPHSAIGSPWMFTGRELDEETGLYYYRARYYDTFKGRFLQRDPSEYIEGMNLYEYAKDNPLKYVDPTGEVIGPAPFAGSVLGSFTGGERRGETTAPRSRGETSRTFTLECRCRDCTLVRQNPCWRMLCTFNVTSIITIEPNDAPRLAAGEIGNLWDDPGWDARYGNTERTRPGPAGETADQRRTRIRNSRIADVRAHERDHQETYEAFYTYNRDMLAAENTRCHATEAACNARRVTVEGRVRENFDRAIEHSRRFDGVGWNTGNQYRNHPLVNQTWPAD